MSRRYSKDPAESTSPCSTGKHSGNIHVKGSAPSLFLLFGFISHWQLWCVDRGKRTVGGVYIPPSKHTHKHTNKFALTFSHTCTCALSLSFLNPFFICVKCDPRTPIPTWGPRLQREIFKAARFYARKICFRDSLHGLHHHPRGAVQVAESVMPKSKAHLWLMRQRVKLVCSLWMGTGCQEPNRLPSRKWVKISVGALLPSETRPCKDKNAQ